MIPNVAAVTLEGEISEVYMHTAAASSAGEECGTGQVSIYTQIWYGVCRDEGGTWVCFHIICKQKQGGKIEESRIRFWIRVHTVVGDNKDG